MTIPNWAAIPPVRERPLPPDEEIVAVGGEKYLEKKRNRANELDNALELVEQLRKPLLAEPDDDEEPRVPWLTRGELWALEQKDRKDD